MQSKNALGNMQKRYSAVLTKCRLLNAFGSLAMVTMLGLGGLGGMVGDAWAYTLPTSGPVVIGSGDSATLVGGSYTADGTTTISDGGSLTLELNGSYNTGGDTTISDGGSLTVESEGKYYAADSTVTVKTGGVVTLEGEGKGTLITDSTGSPAPSALVAKELIIDGGTYTIKNGASTTVEGGSLIVNGGTYTSNDTTISGTGSITVNGGTYSTGGITYISGLGSLTVNAGGLYNTGSADAAWVTEAMQSAGLTPDNLAVFAVAKAGALDVQDGGKLFVGDTTSTASINFGESSLLVVDAGGLNGETALSAPSIIATDGAKLLVSNVQFTDGAVTVNIADAEELAINDAWGVKGEEEVDPSTESPTVEPNTYPNLYFDNGLIAVDDLDLDDTTYSLLLKQISAETVFAETKLSPEFVTLLDKANGNGALSQYLGDATNLENKHEAATHIEGAAKMAVSAGVFHAAMSVAGLGMDAVEGRTDLSLFMSKSAALGYTVDSGTASFYAAHNEVVPDASVSDATTPQIPDRMMNGLAVWAQPMHQSVSAHGLRSGNFGYGYDTDISGASFGADYTVHNNTRFGLACTWAAVSPSPIRASCRIRKTISTL